MENILQTKLTVSSFWSFSLLLWVPKAQARLGYKLLRWLQSTCTIISKTLNPSLAYYNPRFDLFSIVKMKWITLLLPPGSVSGEGKDFWLLQENEAWKQFMAVFYVWGSTISKVTARIHSLLFTTKLSPKNWFGGEKTNLKYSFYQETTM